MKLTVDKYVGITVLDHGTIEVKLDYTFQQFVTYVWKLEIYANSFVYDSWQAMLYQCILLLVRSASCSLMSRHIKLK